MNRRLHLLIILVAASSISPLSADEIVFAGFVATATEGCVVRQGRRSLSLVNADQGYTVEITRFSRLPEPNRQAVGAIIQRYRNSRDVSVSRVERRIQHDLRGTYAEGSAKINDAPSRFWYLALSDQGRIVTVVAHGKASLEQAGADEIASILGSIRSVPLTPAAQSQHHFDFEVSGLGKRWTAQGRIEVARNLPSQQFEPSEIDADKVIDSPSKHAVRVQADGNCGFYTRAGIVTPDWLKFESVSFWVFRDSDVESPTVLEVQAMESDARIRFWRKVTIDHHGWKRYTVPLRWMRWGRGGIPSWKNIDRFGFWFRDQGDLWIDTITLEDRDEKLGALLTTDDVVSIALPGNQRAARVAKSDAVVIIASTPAIDIDQLANHLRKVKNAVDADLAFLGDGKVHGIPKLMIAPTRESYGKFVTDFAAALNSAVTLPQSDGFTLHGISTSFWDPNQGSLRSVYTHEFVHGVLIPRVRLNNSGEWLQEGLATYYQLRFHPQGDIKRIVQQGIDSRRHMTPFARLCNGESIPTNRYWQAMTLVDMLLSHEDYRNRLPKMMAAIQESRSTNLEPILQPVLGKTWQELTDDWRDHCRQKY